MICLLLSSILCLDHLCILDLHPPALAAAGTSSLHIPTHAHIHTHLFTHTNQPTHTHSGAPPMDGMPNIAGMPPMMGGGGTGPAMMFVELLPEKAPDGVAWKSNDVEHLTRAWRGVRNMCVYKSMQNVDVVCTSCYKGINKQYSASSLVHTHPLNNFPPNSFIPLPHSHTHTYTNLSS